MNEIRNILVATLVFAAAPMAGACEYPARPNVPDGASATKAQMVEAQNAVKRFNNGVENYLACIEGVEKSAVGDPEELQQREELFNVKWNAAVDEMEQVAGRYNVAVRTFKARSSDSSRPSSAAAQNKTSTTAEKQSTTRTAGVVIQTYRRPEAENSLILIAVGKDMAQARSNLDSVRAMFLRNTDIGSRTLDEELTCDRPGWWAYVSGHVPVYGGTAREAIGMACGGGRDETLKAAIYQLRTRGNTSDYTVEYGYAGGDSLIFDPNGSSLKVPRCYWHSSGTAYGDEPKGCIGSLTEFF